MNCFTHQQSVAIGICRYCGKGICPACCKESTHGVACSTACASELEKNAELLAISKRTYGIGAKKRLPLGPVFLGLFGLIIIVTALGPMWRDYSPDWLFLGMGVLFEGFAVAIYFRNKSSGLNL